MRIIRWSLVKGSVFVADGYNHKVKQNDLQKKTFITLVSKLGEPGGIAVNGSSLVHDLKTKKATELVLRF